ncbi:RIFT barrel domain-containing protein [Alicycliphilus sp. T452]
MEVASTSSQPQASVPVTFGQPFKAGDWRFTTQGLVAKVDGATIPLQVDEISSHRDGSARFAVLSAQLSNLQPGQSKIINLYTGAKSAGTSSVPSNPDWNLELEAQVYDANGSITTLVAQPQADLVKQIASNAGRRLSGAVANEYTVALPFKNKATGATHPHLTARLHARLMDGGQRIRTDVVMENTRTWTANPGNITYSFAVKRNGSTIYTQPKFTHYHHARWHKVLWTGATAEPQVRVRHSMPYFMASRAIWNYDLSLSIPESVLSAFYSQYTQSKINQANLGPMANLLLTPAFGTTGGRAEIGPVPQWTAFYLVSQDERMKEVMLAHADVAGAVPIHYRDESSNQPLDLDRYPNVSTLRGTSQPMLPAVVNGTTIWDPDTAHQASYAYVPYLITGDAFFQEEMTFWAAWNLTAMSPGYRGYGQGLLWEDQVRGQAWTMRALGEASRIIPDSHAMKTYFQRRLSNNLEWFYQNWVVSPLADVSPMGSPVNPYAMDQVGPWQNDFWTIVMAQHADADEPKAKDLLNWVSKFGVGRFLNEAQGFCLAKAPAYYLQLKNASGKWITSWSELAQVNFPGIACNSALDIEPGSYPTSAGGYAANARAMLATASNLGVPNAASAYALWKAKTPSIDKDFLNNPTWAIVPR